MNITIPIEEYMELRRLAGVKTSNCVFDRDTYCAVLKERSCIKCSFFKTKEQLDEGRRRAKAHVEKLRNREYINSKYWGERNTDSVLSPKAYKGEDGEGER